MRRVIAPLILLAVALPAQAAAQSPPPAAPAQPVQTTMQLTLQRVGGSRRTVLARSRIRVVGAVGAYVPGESITVRFYRGKRKLRTKQVKLQPTPQGAAFFLLGYAPTKAGRLIVRAEHAATPALGALVAQSVPIDVLPRRVGSGSGSLAVRALQSRLARLGYVVGRRGSFDARTRRAVLALRKVTGMARTMQASSQVMRRLARGGGRFRLRFPSHGRHMEADLSLQVLVLSEGGKVRRIYPISSGKPSTPTVTGSFHVYSKTFGTNSKGMVHSAYFIGGYATHGYASVPPYPASHGCLRVPIPDALSLFRWIKIGTPIDVYR